MIIRRTFVLLLLCAPVACAPIVTHGPRPERGLQVTATAGLPRNFCDSNCALDLIPQYGFGARYGRPAENGRPGYSVSGTFSIALVSTEADLYVQAPTAPEWAAGGGVLLSPVHVMPYVQFGRMHAKGSGFYTTQGFAWLAERSNGLWIDGETTAMVTPRYWSPTVAYRVPHRGGAFHLYVSGAFGRMDLEHVGRPPGSPAPPRSAPVRAVMAGISVERNVRTPIMLGPPPPPRGP